jgi:hypothetical protein
MIRRQRLRVLDPTNGTGPAKYGTHGWFAAAIAAGVGAAGSLASGFMGADAAEDAAGIQSQYLDLGIDELRGALDPSIAELNRQQAWSDRHLNRQFRNSMRGIAPYADAGARGLGRLNYLLGTDNGLGPAPTAPRAPKQPKYSKDPAKAAAQKKEYQKALKAYQKAKTKYDTDSAAWKAGTEAAASDPNFGGLMRPYEDRFDSRIEEVAGRKYEDTKGYGQRILDTAAEKYDDKYADEILGVARDKFDLADFEADPGYEFRRSEGGRGIEQSAAARGGLLSGAAAKELTRFNQDTASDEFDRAHGRWADQHNRHLTGLTGQQAFDYGAWADNKNTRLGALSGERAFDYDVWGDQKNTELGSLVDRRNFDYGNWEGNRNFQYGALMDQVGIGQDATDDRNQNRQFYSTARTQNRLANAIQQGNWRQNTANNIAEFLAQQGNAQAAGEVGSANAWGNAFQGVGNMGAYMYGANGNDRPGSGQRRWAWGAPEWWRQNRGVST